MSHFYGTLKGTRGEVTRCGAKASGVRVTAASWSGAVTVRLWYDEDTGRDMFSVEQTSWLGVGDNREVARGYVGEALHGHILLPKPKRQRRKPKGEPSEPG